ncbi:MAG: hypothetical protein RL662_1934 [Bacteroidota bacterium]|jgi:hypothetical protein
MQAILITAYKNYHHLEELINYFDDGYTIYIHIDKKSSILSDTLAKLKSYKQVKYISQRYTIHWGGINHLHAILELAQRALEESDNRYFHLITGHDYPIKSLADFSSFYQSNSDKDFMEFHPLPYHSWPEGGMDRLSRYNFYDVFDGRKGMGERLIKGLSKLQKQLKFSRSFYPDFPKLHGGSTYWSLKKDSLAYVFQYMLKHPQYLKRFKYSFCSEEIFFQTILLNSSFKDNIVNNNLRFIVWEKRNGNFPANLDNTDYTNIVVSDALFARKFEYPASQDLFDNLKKKLTQE